MQRLGQRAEALLNPVFIAMAVLATVAGAAIVALIGASVIMRHVASAPYRFTEELVGLLMTAAFFLALPLVTFRAEHVRVTALVDALPPKLRRLLGPAVCVFGVLFCAWLLTLSIPWFDFAFARGIKTEVARLLLWPWMALVPVSLCLTAAAFVLRGVPGGTEQTKRRTT